ncbi:hypothetical protein Tco_1272045 [Tanacetum coccineum]
MGDANPILTLLGELLQPSHELETGLNVFQQDPSPPGRILLLVSLLNSFHCGTLRDRNAKESWTLLEDLTLYDNESWNDPRDFSKPVKAISLPQDVPSTSDRRLVELENQVQRLMEAHLAPMQPAQVNKITTSCEICSGPQDTQYCMENPKQAFVEYASSRTDRMGSWQFTMNQGPRNFNEATNTWKGKSNFNWAHTQTFTSPRNGSFSTYSSSYQTKLEKALIDFDSHQEKRLSSLRTQLEQQQDDMISKINLLWKAVSEKLDDAPIRDTAGNPVAQVNFTSTNDPIREELRGMGIKSPSKLLSLKYLSQSSLAEQNRNPSSQKVFTFTTEYEDHEMIVESEEEFEEENEDEIEEEEEDSPKHFDTFLTIKELRVKGLKVFVRNFTYECDFMVLEDTTSVIDHDLGSVIFRKPFVEATGLVYDREERTITFEKDKEKIVFKMPHKMEMFKHIDFTDIKTDRIPPFVIESDDDSSKKTYYSDSLDLGPEYKMMKICGDPFRA